MSFLAENYEYYVYSQFLNCANNNQCDESRDKDSVDENVSNQPAASHTAVDKLVEHQELERRSTLLNQLAEEQVHHDQKSEDKRYTDVYENSIDVQKVFNDDPSLHQDIINYLGSRPMKEKIIMSKSRLVPPWEVQFFTILSFWLINCGICCIVCAIVGVTTTRFEFTKELKLGENSSTKMSLAVIWFIGFVLIVLNFIITSSFLLIYSCSSKKDEQEKFD
ncbi:hypothetical protein BOX15_Mlig030147g4 [Macrostomum lignano]|uniref:Uncharacterized protein n=2 Tax=Macrostomum lignano TaxID=282301 RepID=A0A267DPH7_9PLAT|nr:hypothetical protein BOX15_Mlig030147g4 [Macrostomum lignano]